MAPLSTVIPNSASTPSFEAEANAVLGEMHAAIAQVLQHLPGPIDRAVDVQRALELETKLAWQVFRLSQSSMLREAANVPSPATMRRFLAAAKAKRIPALAIDRVAAAFAAFETLAREHGGDREGLIAMMAARSVEWDSEIAEKFRKSAFRGNAHIWGLQAQLRATSFVLHPGPDEADELLIVQGNIGLQSMRESQPITVRAGANAGTVTPAPAPPDAPIPRGPGSLTLLEQFCTKPIPRMRSKALSGGGEHAELVVPAGGRAAAVTLYTSMVLLEPRDKTRARFDGAGLITTPSEEHVVDMLIPVGWSDVGTAKVAIYGRRDLGAGVEERRKEDLLPQRETIAYVGTMESPPEMEGAPRQREAVRYMLERLGWLGTRFDVFRSRIRYPVMHSLVCHSVDDVRS